MNILLDTHALLWALADDVRLSKTARSLLVDLSHTILVSAVSAWEIAVKTSIGKLEAPHDLLSAVRSAQFVTHAIDFEDTETLRTLPLHHRDPFDRMLIAQAKNLRVPIMTCDPVISRYDVETVW